MIEVERDLAIYGDEVKLGGGKVIPHGPVVGREVRSPLAGARIVQGFRQKVMGKV